MLNSSLSFVNNKNPTPEKRKVKQVWGLGAASNYRSWEAHSCAKEVLLTGENLDKISSKQRIFILYT